MTWPATRLLPVVHGIELELEVEDILQPALEEAQHPRRLLAPAHLHIGRLDHLVEEAVVSGEALLELPVVLGISYVDRRHQLHGGPVIAGVGRYGGLERPLASLPGDVADEVRGLRDCLRGSPGQKEKSARDRDASGSHRV